MSTKIILDCDTGVDDTMAIMYAALHPEIDLLAVGTVWGNVDVPMATRNTLHTLELVDRTDVPVAQGAAGPLLGKETHYAYFVHGDDGQGNAYSGRVPSGSVEPITAAQQIVEIVRANPGEVWLVPVGPLTNIAMALAIDPELPQLVAGVSLMGGTAQAPGNVSPVAEANIAHDAEAAAAVFRAPWPIIMAGLDVTMDILITPERRSVLDAGGEAARYLSQIMEFYGDFVGQSFGGWTATMHDSIAVAAAAGHLDIRLAPVVHVEVDYSEGPSHGQTICDLRGKYLGYPRQEGAHCTVLLEVGDSIADSVLELIASFRGSGDGS